MTNSSAVIPMPISVQIHSLNAVGSPCEPRMIAPTVLVAAPESGLKCRCFISPSVIGRNAAAARPPDTIRPL